MNFVYRHHVLSIVIKEGSGITLKKGIFLYISQNFMYWTYLNVLCMGGPWWSWSYGSWIYNYLRYQCLSPLMLWVWISLRRGVLDTTLCDKVCQW